MTLQANKRKAVYRPSFTFIGILLGFVVSLFLPANPGVVVVQPTLFLIPLARFGNCGFLRTDWRLNRSDAVHRPEGCSDSTSGIVCRSIKS